VRRPGRAVASHDGGQLTEYRATSGTVARQFIFSFSDDASAQQTFTWLTVKTSKSYPVDLSPYNREYFVQRGSTIAYVEIEATATLPTTYDDAAQISTTASHLCVYGGSCE